MQIMSKKVQEKSLFVQFEIKLSTQFQPPRSSIVGLKAQSTFYLLPTKTDIKIHCSSKILNIFNNNQTGR